MKKIIFSTSICLMLLLSSCDLFRIDNYDEPAETLRGVVVDKETGNPILTDQGSEGIRVRLTELSWGDNAVHNPDFSAKKDGTFQNTKLFKGHYNVRIDGPFIPLLRENSDGTLIGDETQNIDIKGVTNVKFEVQPFLNIEWVGEPTISNGKVTAKVRVNRGVSPEEFRNKVEPMGGYNNNFLNITDIQLFVSYSPDVGYRARDDRWSSKIDFNQAEFEPLLGNEITITSNGTIPPGRTVFVRAASRINYETPKGSGTRRWNYNEAKELMVPN